MSIEFECPHCHTSMSVGDQFSGTTGPCRTCGESITIPGQAMHAQGPPAKSSFSVPVIAILGGCLVVAVLGMAVLVALLLPAVQAAREAARRAQCSNNEKQIALALLNYEMEHGEFPPAYVADENGTPMHSWRVLILPYLEQQAMFDQYNMDEPWDSPGNQEVTAMMPEVYQFYRCPSSAESFPDTDTSYFVISDAESMFPEDRGRKLRDIVDGTTSTVMVVECAGRGVHWAEPVDLSMDELDQIVSDHAGDIINIAFADGHVESARAVDRSMVTAAGND